MATVFVSDHDARMAALRAVRSIARVVGITFGPRGGHVLLECKGRGPRFTRDGAAVARTLALEDPAENLAVQVVRAGADRTARYTGDGSTTTILLAAGAIEAGIKSIAAGHDPAA